ncbi:MAG TPA: hypothetical protein VGM02_08305 [Acidobacteriaceae bacterium]|jgi:hypothetical protein
MRLNLRSIVCGAAFLAVLGEPLYASTTDTSQQSASVTPAPEAGPNRPSNVPEGYIVTPFGYFHPSCLQRLAKGERLLADARVQHADGSVNAKAAVCTYPHYLQSGISPKSAKSSAPSAINGWVASASITTGSATQSYGALTARWTVPPQPYVDNGQVLYFFPGFEDINDSQTSILQPVLGWYQGQWTIASWNCCLSGIVTSSPSVNVTAGDRIYGSVTSSCSRGTLSCATWNVLSVDLSTGESTTLGSTPSDGQVFNWAFGGVLEAYYVTSCDDYPSDGQLAFDQVTVFDENLQPLAHQKWSEGVDTTDTPQCGYSLTTVRRKITVSF